MANFKRQFCAKCGRTACYSTPSLNDIDGLLCTKCTFRLNEDKRYNSLSYEDQKWFA